MKNLLFVFSLLACISCSVQFAPPSEIQQASTVHHITGLQGWLASPSRTVSIGKLLQAKHIKPGWQRSFTQTGRPKEGALQPQHELFFNTLEQSSSTHRFSFETEGASLHTRFYGVEKVNQEQVKALKGIFKNATQTISEKYTLSGVILTSDSTDNQWNLIFYNQTKEGDENTWKEGIVTNLKKTIAIRPIRQTEPASTKKGKEISIHKDLLLLAGYGFYEDNVLIGFLETVNQSQEKLWVKNTMPADTQLILGNVSVAILLRSQNDTE